MHKAIRKLTRSARWPGRSSNKFIEDEMKRKHPSLDDGPGSSGSGGSGASSSKAHDDSGMDALIGLLVPEKDGNKASSSGLTHTGLKSILTLFPDICPRYITTLYQDMLETKPLLYDEALVDEILLRGTYPTINDSKRLKIDEDRGKKIHWGHNDNVKRDTRYWKCCISLLKVDFPLVPMPYIVDTLHRKNGCMYDAYLHLDLKEATYDTLNPRPYTKEDTFKNTKVMANFTKEVEKYQTKDTKLELQDARAERKRRTVARALKEQEMERENKNLAHHTATGGLVECHCCYGDTPLNRIVSCTAKEAHSFCWRCMKSNAEIQVGLMKYDIHCMDMSGCKAKFSKEDLVKSIGNTIVKKLSDLQQREEIDKAGLKDLEECPFCDYKAIYPPIEENREFRCLKPGCMRVSCRRCRKASHIPKTCEEMDKEKHTPIRQAIEEAMSEAIIRICPNEKCKTPIIKESGCNKMWCTKCKTIMCYVCKQDITQTGYKHFSESTGPDKCMLYDSNLPTSRHHDELTKAHRAALNKVLKDNPELREEDINVKAPDPAEFGRAAVPFDPRIRGVHWNMPGLPPVQPPEPAIHNGYGRAQNQQQQQPGAQAVPGQPNAQEPAGELIPGPPLEFQLVELVGVYPTAQDIARGAVPRPVWYERYNFVPQPPPPGLPAITYVGGPVNDDRNPPPPAHNPIHPHPPPIRPPGDAANQRGAVQPLADRNARPASQQHAPHNGHCHCDDHYYLPRR